MMPSEPKQLQEYKDIICSSDFLVDVIEKLAEIMRELNIKDYSLSGGAVYQIVWNYKLSQGLQYGLGDLDVVYYDNCLSEEKEAYAQDRVREHLAYQKYPVEVTNQARVHLWNKSMHHVESNSLTSLEDAIASWMPLCACVGIRKTEEGLLVIAPYGLDDIFNLTVRPNNKPEKSQTVYNQKVLKWSELWRDLTVIPW
ncbi:hypothetical protein AGMMS49975_15830 [Clostridia bacterium]|nr:hypothetical protein AGMMS49975_15830 [Clostridia bacterium]